jgi:hypothetical protein
VPSGTHVCGFFSRPAERDMAVMPFLVHNNRHHIDPGEFLRDPV